LAMGAKSADGPSMIAGRWRHDILSIRVSSGLSCLEKHR
jgi:hypothetical protein